jgi:hypothetical protein
MGARLASLAFLLAGCSAQPVSASPPETPPSASAPATPQTASGPVCAPSTTVSLPENSTPRLREINAALRAMTPASQEFFNFGKLILCDGIAQPGETGYGMSDGSGNMLLALQPELGRTGRDLYDILETQTAYYNALPLILNHKVDDNIRLSRLAMSHRFWHIAETAEQLAGNGQPALRDFLLSDAAVNSNEVLLIHAAKFAKAYHDVRTGDAAETDPEKAFVKTLTNLQSTPTDYYAVFDGILLLGYFEAFNRSDASSPAGASLATMTMPRTYPHQLFPDVSQDSINRIFELPVTSSIPQIADGLRLLRTPEALRRPAQPEPEFVPAPGQLSPRVIIA